MNIAANEVDEVRIRTRQARAMRHADSAPIVISGITALATGLIRGDGIFGVQALLMPCISVAAIYIFMAVQRKVLGIGMGVERYGLVALITIAVTLLFPAPVYFFGPLFMVGLVLAYLGFRGRSWALALSGAVTSAASVMIEVGAGRNFLLASYLVTGFALVCLGLFIYGTERRTLRESRSL